jgi:hypothetical protein
LPWSASFEEIVLAAMATGHDTTWLEWHMPIAKVKQAAAIYQHMNGVRMRIPSDQADGVPHSQQV